MSHRYAKLSEKVFVRLDDAMVAMLDELVLRRERDFLEVLSRASAVRKILSACVEEGRIEVPRTRGGAHVAPDPVGRQRLS